jgi:hypothetical protein
MNLAALGCLRGEDQSLSTVDTGADMLTGSLLQGPLDARRALGMGTAVNSRGAAVECSSRSRLEFIVSALSVTSGRLISRISDVNGYGIVLPFDVSRAIDYD